MVRISTSSKFKLEKEYILYVVFNEILDVEFILDFTSNIDSYFDIQLPNQNFVRFHDYYFSLYSEKGLYSLTNIPTSVSFSQNDFCTNKDLPIIYGKYKLVINDHFIDCHIDIFSSIFFMLTRWEETVIPTTDVHSRFPGTESLAYKFNF